MYDADLRLLAYGKNEKSAMLASATVERIPCLFRPLARHFLDRPL